MPDENNAMIRILIFISALLFFIPFANAEDIFNGTILFKNNDWHFVRCSITQDDYLIEAPQEVFTQFKELQQQQKNYWVSVLAEVNEQQNGNLILKIEKIDEVHLGETCHLLEALKNFENRE
ncbi:hypothetical protein [Acinetobacter baumannii]|uniref:hypothetical protein n=1 Tax=Acinetobacter baumannii TaxID=470 RepID=UPI0002CE8230|nr:hypothetical protein [Acinetobacter baumannii]ENV31153.1 hypothetical protein F961_00314 [Acinetobacter baumannii NIPH 60]MCZ2937855.1 hypothetical protein [Acinetobacter baumannii]MCZ3069483.1 hypothetical protein [Acinetobacter baumannii]MCZ3088495.1 hypothetical protein [Acinetobacter baumannii]MCZ3184515.1 hypothetical protein [Acinetobacter baumannii]